MEMEIACTKNIRWLNELRRLVKAGRFLKFNVLSIGERRQEVDKRIVIFLSTKWLILLKGCRG
jgi:hypothetical protein